MISNIIIFWCILAIYFYIGYQIHLYCIDEISKDNYYGKLYNTLTHTYKFIIMLITVIFWLPAIIGEVIISIISWIAKYHDLY